MKIQQDAYTTISYTLRNDTGDIIDQAGEESPLGFVFGRGMIIPGLETALEGMGADESKDVKVAPEEGYGVPKDELFQKIPKSNFPSADELTEGQQFQANTPHGPMRFIVDKIEDEDVVVNLNHPLAGENLNFEVKVLEVREATEEELTPHSHDGCDGSHECDSCGH